MEFLSAEANYTLQFINQTNKSIFLTGKAGTGKTTLLKEIIKTTHKNTVVVAPTGIAALNAGGVTIHSMFQLPFGAFLPDNKNISSFAGNIKFESRATLARHFKMNGTKKSVIRNMELLIIDEVSMLRADILDAMDFMLRKIRKLERPFGGVQVLFIGDLLQLPPVVKNEEWQLLKNYYSGMFFFHSHVMQQYPPLYIELEKIYRQTDNLFINVLNNLRQNKITNEDISVLNKFVQPNFDLKNNKGYITLTTHNSKADLINEQSLKDLKGKSSFYSPEIVGDFPEKIYPLEEKLELKIGAQVMFVKNDLNFEKQYFNGKMGVISSLSSEEIRVHFPEENKTIEVDKYEWQNIRFKVNEDTKEIEEEVVGTFVHYPIKLAWAITVHKSQGLTFDKAALDVSQVFAPGQAYVALSRLRSLNGLILLSKIQMNGISSDVDVLSYAENKSTEEALAKSLVKETQNFVFQYLTNAFNFKDLIQEWRNHFYSYNSEAPKSVKIKHTSWAKNQYEQLAKIEIFSEKFLSQIHSLFSKDSIDNDFVNKRCIAAYDFFFNILDQIAEELLLKLEEIKRIKKVKAFYEELYTLEEIHINTILKLKKAKLLTSIITQGKKITKENLTSQDIATYKINKLVTVSERFRKEFSTLIEEEETYTYYEEKPKKKKTKAPKKSTIEETLELWNQNVSIEEIAVLRKLTPQTIFNHFSKLIQMEIVEISDILTQDRISVLKEVFNGYNDQSLSELKEKHGESISWDELRLYKASLK